MANRNATTRDIDTVFYFLVGLIVILSLMQSHHLGAKLDAICAAVSCEPTVEGNEP